MPTSSAANHQIGDRVQHPTKPEWGVGQVVSTQPATQDGRPCQRLQIRFDRAGLKTITTAFVELRPVAGDHASPNGLVEDEPDHAERLTQLPEPATDPFGTPASRLRATLDLYRHTDDGPGLIGWATAITGLADPLARFSRHELEERFARWRVLRDQQLAKVSLEARSLDVPELQSIIAAAPSPARDALKRVNRRR